MTTAAQVAPLEQKRWMTWTGRVFSAIPVLVLAMSAAMGLQHGPEVVAGMARFGYSENLTTLVAVLALSSALLYAIPRTAVLGAILMTAYFGAAVATHVRIGDPGWPLAILMAIFTWGGLSGRNARLRDLLPLRKPF